MTNICLSCFHENALGDRFCSVCGNSLTPSSGPQLPAGTLLKQNNYQIENFLGQGAFGITYKAVYRPNTARVAIKELWAEQGYRQGTTLVWPPFISPADKKEQIAKFKFEAACLQRCQSPYIAKVYDCFEENLTVYMVMELIDGSPLDKVLKNQKILEENQVIEYTKQIAISLDRVHQSNLLHRDIKPGNVIVDKSDRAVLIDFGTAREFIAGKTGDMTRILTPEYAPIEQYLSKTKRFPATDIYALCASMYELLTGELPSTSLDRAHSLSQGLPDPLISPRQINSKISPYLEQVILRGMHFRIEERIQTARDLIDALDNKGRQSPVSTTTVTPARLVAKYPNTSQPKFTLNGITFVGAIHSESSPVDIDLDKFIGGETVSHLHAKIYHEAGVWKIEDLNSKNGTFIKPNNQNRFGTKIEYPTSLSSGNEISFGKVQFIFECPLSKNK